MENFIMILKVKFDKFDFCVFLFICGQYIGNAGSKHFKLITKLLKDLQSKCVLTHQCCMQVFHMEFAK